MLKKSSFVLLLSFFGIFLGNFANVRSAFAWKPNTHAYLADQARMDAVNDGKVTIWRVDYQTGEILDQIGEYEVDPVTLNALRQFPSQYLAGVIGPDAYPDILTGQQTIHPNNGDVGGTVTNDWLEYLWRKSEVAPYNTLPIRSFVIGYLTHAAGDMYGHTFVNNFTGGEFELGENALKHIVLEGYVGKRTPEPSSYNIRIDGVREFIYREMVDARPDEELYENLLKGGGSEYSVPRIYSRLRAELQRDIDDYDNTINNFNRRIDEKKRAARDCDPLDFSCSAVALRAQAAAIELEKQGFIAANGWKRAYKVEWRRDIDDGLREWPIFSHELAKAMTFNASGVDRNRVNTLVGDYVEDHLISMSGAPDLSIDFISVIEDIFSTIPFIDEQIKRMKRDFLNYLLEEATGWTLEEIERYLSNPERYFDEVMGRGAGQSTNLESFNRNVLRISDRGFDPDFNGQGKPETFNYQNLPAAYNTVTMSKLILMKPSEVDRLLSDLNSSERLAKPNSMLGFIETLDGENEWLKGMVFAKDCQAYKQIFLEQIGETPCESAQSFAGESIAVGQNRDGRLEVFWRGNDGQLWHAWQEAPGSAWTGASPLGVGGASDIAVGQNRDGRLEVFWRGNDGQLWHAWQEAPGSGWSGASPLGVGIASDISVGQNRDGRLEVFWRGNDGQLWHAWQEAPGSGWSGANRFVSN